MFVFRQFSLPLEDLTTGMEIKPPSATAPITRESVTIQPGQPGSAAGQASAPPASTLRLGPAMFQIGQILEVIVARAEANALLLMLKNPIIDEHGQRINLQLRAPLGSPAQPGQQLTVQVKGLENGVPQLQVLATGKTPDIAVALQNAQQLQQGLPPLLANLRQLQTPEAKAHFTQLPNAVQERIQTLWRTLPESNQLQRLTGIKQALQQSGPFLQSTLLGMAQGQARNYPAMDVQTGLLRLASAIRGQLDVQAQLARATGTATETGASRSPAATSTTGSPSAALQQNAAVSTTSGADPKSAAQANSDAGKPPHPVVPQAQPRAVANMPMLGADQILEQVLQQTEASLARILTQQLQSLAQDPQRPTWLLELPVRHDNGVDVFDMRIHRDGKDQDPQQQAHHNWTVMLAFDLEGLGPVRVQISLQQDLVSTYWWADNPVTATLFQQHIDTLRTRMNAAGLQVNRLDCQIGIPDAERPQPRLPLTDTMVDETI